MLAVDDEPPALDELAYLLRADPRVGEVRHRAGDAVSALRVLEGRPVDGVFLDIRMPGLDGLELARVLARFSAPPPVVFVTAYDDAAVDAFALHATDYLLKPLRADRLAEAVRRLAAAASRSPRSAGRAARTRPSRSSSAGSPASSRWPTCATSRRTATTPGCTPPAAATSSASRWPRWRSAGRAPASSGSTAPTSSAPRTSASCGSSPAAARVVVVGGTTLPVSRRHARELKDRLVRRARRESGP